jgi:hypothetical protein
VEAFAAEQQHLRAALGGSSSDTFDFGIRKLEAPRWQPAAGSEASAELASVEARRNGQPWGTMSSAGLMRRQACS